jgi:hypothetical protein
MSGQATVALDVGKTLTKLSLWGADGRLIAHRNRLNERIETGSYVGLDACGVETFVAESLEHLRTWQRRGDHSGGPWNGCRGPREGGLLLPPFDYECPVPAAVRNAMPST